MFHIAFVLSYAWHVFLDSYTVNVTYEYWTFEIRFIHFLTNIEMMQLSHVVAKDLWNDRQRSLVYMLLREIPIAWFNVAFIYTIHSILFHRCGCPFFLSELDTNHCPFMAYILK